MFFGLCIVIILLEAGVQLMTVRHQELLMPTVKRRKLSWFGNVCRHDTLPKIILQGYMDGKRRRGRLCKYWKDIKEWTGQSMSSLLPKSWAAITAEASVGVPQRRLGISADSMGAIATTVKNPWWRRFPPQQRSGEQSGMLAKLTCERIPRTSGAKLSYVHRTAGMNEVSISPTSASYRPTTTFAICKTSW